MYDNGEILRDDQHFQDHIDHHIPIQVYLNDEYRDIGYAEAINTHFIRINQTFYNRMIYRFISRPGY